MAKEFAGPDARQKFGASCSKFRGKSAARSTIYFFLFYQDHCLDGVFIKFLMFS